MFATISTLLKLRSDDPEVRKAALKAAAASTSGIVFGRIVRAFGDSKQDVRLEAIFAATSSKCPSAATMLAKALKHEAPSIRIGAANAIGARASAMEAERGPAFDALAAALQSESDRNTATVIALGLRNTQDPRAADALIRAAKNTKYLEPSLAGTTALIAVEQQPKIYAAFDHVLKESVYADVMSAAAKGLASYNDPNAVTSILARMRSVREAYAGWKDGALYGYENPITAMLPHFLTALAAVKHPQKTELLIKGTNDSDQPVRVLATLALGQTRDPKAEEPLVRLTADADAGVRAGAEEALHELRQSLT